MTTLESARQVASRGRRLGEPAAYGTHLPALIELLLRTDGPVLEIGGGLFSTPILSLICARQVRRLVTVETDPEWRLELERHFMHELLPDWPAGLNCEPFWSVVLIDHDELPRQPALQIAGLKATFCVCHDTLGFKGYGWDFSDFKYRRDWTDILPATTAVSNVEQP